MHSLQRLKKWLSILDKSIALLLGLVVTIFGVFTIYLFIAEPALNHLPIDPTEVVLAFGIFAIGISMFVGVLRGTSTAFWLGMANMIAWFLLYGITFDVSRKVPPNFHSLISLSSNLILLVVFMYMARRSYLKKRGAKINP